MPNSEKDAPAALAEARRGSRQALGQLFEQYRNYLLLIAQRDLDPAVRAKGGASDLVQETFLEAQRDFERFQGDTEEELLAWLKKLLSNNLKNFARRYATAKRQIRRELPLESAWSSHAGRNRLPDSARSPCDLVIAAERARRVREALGRLPAEYRAVLLLRCRDDLPFEEIGRRLGRTKNAAQKLCARALDRFKHELGDAP